MAVLKKHYIDEQVSALFNMEYNTIHKICISISQKMCSYVPKAYQAEDLCQEAEIKVYNSLYKYDNKKSLKAFINKVARNAILDAKRRFNSNGQEFFVTTVDQIQIKADEDNGNFSVLIEKSIDQLPPRQQFVIKNHYFNELDLKEIAEKLCITRQTVSADRNKSLEHLRKILKS